MHNLDMKNWFGGLAVGLIALLTACGTQTNFTGSVKGVSLNVIDSVYAVVPASGGTGEILYVLTSDVANLCTQVQNNITPKSSTSFVLEFYNPAITGHVTPRLYPVNGTSAMLYASFAKTGPQCQALVSMSATAGAARIDSLSPLSSVSGTFNLKFNQDAGTGSFSAGYCPALLKYLQGTPRCAQAI